jgi:hypothetical protein
MSRSQSRGREEYSSSGRGGVGNLRPQSRDPVARTRGGPEDFSPSRGREVRSTYTEPVTHSGRGGAGNVRSPSRDPEGERKNYEAEGKLVKDYDSHQHIHSSGRGGVGNIDRNIDRSRSRDVPRDVPHNNKSGVLGNLIGRISRDVSTERHSTSTDHHTAGRGGYGNTYDGATPNASKTERAEEEERNAYKGSLDEGGAHTSGRGGYGNTSSTPGTGGYDTKAPHHANGDHHAYASGRGGVGNIHTDD